MLLLFIFIAALIPFFIIAAYYAFRRHAMFRYVVIFVGSPQSHSALSPPLSRFAFAIVTMLRRRRQSFRHALRRHATVIRCRAIIDMKWHARTAAIIDMLIFFALFDAAITL